MDYDKKLISNARRSRCRICHEYITEQEADACEFQATKTSSGYNFVHSRCWDKLMKGGTKNE